MDYVLIALLLLLVDWIVLRSLLILWLRLIKKWRQKRMSENIQYRHWGWDTLKISWKKRHLHHFCKAFAENMACFKDMKIFRLLESILTVKVAQRQCLQNSKGKKYFPQILLLTHHTNLLISVSESLFKNRFFVCLDFIKWKIREHFFQSSSMCCLSTKWKINSKIFIALVGPCDSEGKGDISPWLGGKGVYIQTASMTNISCSREHSLFRSHTRRQVLSEDHLTTMTCVRLKPAQRMPTEGFIFGFCVLSLHKNNCILLLCECFDICTWHRAWAVINLSVVIT